MSVDSTSGSSGLSIARIVWAALALSTIVYAALTAMIPVEASEKSNDLVPLLALISIGVGVASFVLRALLGRASSASPSGEGLKPYIGYITAAAMAESIAVFGVVLHFLGQPQATTLLFFAGALLLMALHFPKQIGVRRRFGEEPSFG